MKLKLYSVKDELNGFMAPMVFPNSATAIRAFKLDAENNPLIKANPNDYNIYYIGELETDTGEITPAEGKYLTHPIEALLAGESEGEKWIL